MPSMRTFVFVREASWNLDLDQPPSVRGQLPLWLVLPSGEFIHFSTIVIDAAARNMAEHNATMGSGRRQTFLAIHPGVRLKRSITCTYNSEEGSSREEWIVEAPEGTRFAFEMTCPWCGQHSGETVLSEEQARDAPASLLHEQCALRQQTWERCFATQE